MNTAVVRLYRACFCHLLWNGSSDGKENERKSDETKKETKENRETIPFSPFNRGKRSSERGAILEERKMRCWSHGKHCFTVQGRRKRTVRTGIGPGGRTESQGMNRMILAFQDIPACRVAVTARAWTAPGCWRAARVFPSAPPTVQTIPCPSWRPYPRTKRFTPGETMVSWRPCFAAFCLSLSLSFSISISISLFLPSFCFYPPHNMLYLRNSFGFPLPPSHKARSSTSPRRMCIRRWSAAILSICW